MAAVVHCRTVQVDASTVSTTFATPLGYHNAIIVFFWECSNPVAFHLLVGGSMVLYLGLIIATLQFYAMYHKPSDKDGKSTNKVVLKPIVGFREQFYYHCYIVIF